eukprot:16450939-Heterocapsa_arctica.AAC.1
MRSPAWSSAGARRRTCRAGTRRHMRMWSKIRRETRTLPKMQLRPRVRDAPGDRRSSPSRR